MPRTSKKSSNATQKASAKRSGRQPRLKDATTTSLLSELDRRRAVLQEERAELIDLLEDVEAHLADLEAAPAARKKKRRRSNQAKRNSSKSGTRRNKAVLADVLYTVVAGKDMSVPEAADAVLKAGYKTKSSTTNFRVMINQTLTKDKRFTRVSRGVYTAA